MYRCFIIIDDIWDIQSWKLIKCALQDSDCRSRVVITTRIFGVATYADDVYDMQPLSPEKSEKLFYARMFAGDGKHLDRPSAETCELFLKKCCGLPLAIITIASLLANKPEEEWSEVYYSFGFGNTDNYDDVENARRILSFSYYDLPSRLKACLLYLSTFSENHMIEKNSLIWMWIAEGFIHAEPGVGLFELGERYFNELINRGLIQAEETEYEGYVDACSVNIMVLDLIRSLSTDENFSTVLDGRERQKLPRSIARRLLLKCFERHNSSQLTTNVDVSKVRSLFASQCDFGASFPRFPCLRVLDMINCRAEEGREEGMLDHLWSLLQLRYLGLGLGLIELPRKVRYLKFLQTLDLRGSFVKELPNGVGLLTQLVCLRSDCETRVPAGLIGKLTSLQELAIHPTANARMHFVKELGLLRELRVLRTMIDGTSESMGRTLLESIGNLHKIRYLNIEEAHPSLPSSFGSSPIPSTLLFSSPSPSSPMAKTLREAQRELAFSLLGNCRMTDAGFVTCQHLRFLRLEWIVFSGLPGWINSSLAPNLSYLCLKVLVMKEQDVETLARLPELRCLKLHSCDTKLLVIKILTENVGYFRNLRTLHLYNTSIWFDPHGSKCRSSSRIESTIMPSLESLSFDVHVRFLKDATTLFGFDKLLGFENIGRSSLQIVTAYVNCGNARASEVEEVEAALVHAATVHPKHPTLQTARLEEDDLLSPYQEVTSPVTKLVDQVKSMEVSAAPSLHQTNVDEEPGESSTDRTMGSGSSSDPPLPPGYRFYPTEEELLSFYLRHRLAGTMPQVEHFIPVVDIYRYHPSELQAMAGVANVGDKEQWFFFCPWAERELHGGRPARTTPSGYWKAAEVASYVYSAPANRVIGEKRTMVFYEGRAPMGKKTRWKMNEYKAADGAPLLLAAGAPVRLRNEFRVCRVYISTGTLKSFDCRPLNPAGGVDQALHCYQQQQVQLAPPPPPAAAAAASQMPAVDGVDQALNVSEEHGESSTEGMTNSTQGTMEAPVSSSLGAMGSLFRKLGILLDPKYPLRSSLKHAIKLLVEDLEEIRDAHMEQLMADSHNSKAKYWMEEVRELSYDIEDSIDFMMLSHNAANEKPRSIHAPKLRVARLKIRGLPSMLKLSTRIVRVAELRTLLWEASERHARYQLDGCVSKPRSVFSGRSSRITLVYKVVADPIGIEGPKKELTMWLTNQAEQQLKVLCIFGPAGIGKTTLAKELYRELGGKFDCRAFIRVSRNPDISRLLQELLYQILRPNKQNLYACSVQGDIENIRKHLEDKRYFIVIDDLWEAEAWDIIKNVFPNGSNCSRVIITCEVKNIALECSGYHTVDTFEMKPLGSQDSENLFLDRAFSSDNQFPDPLIFRMLKECGGLPLAIISAAGLFASLRDNSDIWHQLLQSVLSTLENLSLEDMLKQIVSICYNNLPQELKTCLLYLTMYPVGCTIWKDDLLKQWAAEGFITTTKGNEGVAENYFNELVKRGMIQPEKINYNNEVLSCTVHHVVLDLITYKSRQENFITAVDYSRTNAMFLMKARRLSLHYSCAQYATEPEGIRVSQVRSLAFFGLPRCMPSVIEFKLLRVLILEFWGNKDDCTSVNLSRICGLCLLRYLKISSQIYVELPSEIQGLKFLEILEIDARVSAVLNEKMLEIDAKESAVPNDIVHLPGLLHLGIRDGTKLPDRIGLITSLQTLKCFDLGYNSEDNVQSLGELINLRDLHLTCSKEVSHEHLKRKLVALASSFGRLANLKSLTLAHGAVGMTMFVDHSSAIFSTPMFLQRLELPPICTFSRLPEWIGKLRKLCVLKIVVRVLLRSDIDILTGLPGLTVLSLYVRQPNAEGVVFNSGEFPVLKYFKYRCSALCIAFREEALPNLRRLKVCFNFHRDEIYSHMISGVEHLLNLKEIAVRIGAADGGVEESDRRAVESAFESTIRKHPTFPIYMNVRRFDWVE
uniref:NAC domain-containing protein n=1 Tax=Setaria viridis TaxID=4556 RepID=A0A4U6TBE3_SETVI|nr:hypothetical protein SEVIR_8G038000v2 [Setaria viridis]